MSKPLIDEIVCKIVDSFTDELRWDYYYNVIRKDPDFDITTHTTTGSPEDMTRELVFQYIYNKVWSSANEEMTEEEFERVFLV